jgi:hypothetical protein
MAWRDRAYRSARRDGTITATLAGAADTAKAAVEIPQPRSGGPDPDVFPDALPPEITWDDPGRYPWQ